MVEEPGPAAEHLRLIKRGQAQCGAQIKDGEYRPVMPAFLPHPRKNDRARQRNEDVAKVRLQNCHTLENATQRVEKTRMWQKTDAREVHVTRRRKRDGASKGKGREAVAPDWMARVKGAQTMAQRSAGKARRDAMDTNGGYAGRRRHGAWRAGTEPHRGCQSPAKVARGRNCCGSADCRRGPGRGRGQPRAAGGAMGRPGLGAQCGRRSYASRRQRRATGREGRQHAFNGRLPALWQSRPWRRSAPSSDYARLWRFINPSIERWNNDRYAVNGPFGRY